MPRSELAKMIRFVAGVASKYKLRIGTFGHMGDGNLHPTFLTDERNKEEMHRVEEAFKEIFDEAIRLGGTITGEHGVGVAKKSLPAQVCRRRPDARHARAAPRAGPEGHSESGEDVRMTGSRRDHFHPSTARMDADLRQSNGSVKAGSGRGRGLR